MKYTTAVVLALAGLSSAVPVPEPGPLNKYTPPARMLRGREVPQEHSHEQFLTTVRASLNLNNPQGITDPVFGLLGDAAAAQGLGKTTNPDCLQQNTADQAFTNAKKAADVTGMTAALIYRALERNTGKVGLASVACNATAVNPEIAAISQHQDPASAGAAAINKGIALELAKQIKSIGGNEQDALKSGTFAPGSTSDSTGKGNTCDVATDTVGCIFTQNLLVEDATAAEITAAAAGVVAPIASVPAASNSTANNATDGACAAAQTTTVTAVNGTATPASDVASGANVQTFSGALGGIAAAPVLFTAGAARPFAVDGSTDVNKGAALQRSCDVQHNACANAANSGSLAGGVAQCETQHTACIASGTAKKEKRGQNVQTFTGALGGISAGPVVFTAGAARPFAVDNTTDINKGAAIQRSCDVQHNKCSSAANSGIIGGGVAQCETQHTACIAAGQTAKDKRAALDFGQCSNPTIVFGAGFDGRNEDSFEPANKAEFNHGSALKIGVVASFICGQLSSACKAGAATIAACTAAQSAASSQTGQAAADAFNAALGMGGAAAAANSTIGKVAPAGKANVAC